MAIISNQSDGSKVVSYELEPFKEWIYDLYMRKNMALPEVMSIINQQGCNASRNMYLKKMKTWGFEKYQKHKAPGYKAKAAQRGGKKLSHGGSPKTRPTEMIKNTKNSPGSLDSFSPASPLRLPDSIYNQQQFFQTLFDTEGLYARIGGERPEAIRSFHVDIGFGTHMMYQGQTKNGAAMIERGLRLLDQVLQNAVYASIPRIIYGIRFMLFRHLNALAETFARYVYQLSLRMFGPNHPLAILMGAMYQNWDSVEVLHTGLKVAYDVTVETIGKFHPVAMEQLRTILLSLSLSGSVSEVCEYHEKVISLSDQMKDRRQGIQSRSVYGQYLAGRGYYEKGVALLQEVSDLLKYPSQIDDRMQATAIRSRCRLGYFIMAQPTLQNFSEDEEAQKRRYIKVENIYKTTVETSIQLLGPKHAETIYACSQLADFYEEYGEPVESQSQVEFLNSQLQDFHLTGDKASLQVDAGGK